MIHVAEFFSWAETCGERFDCAAGNPPFIRYQHFVGSEREAALRLCRRLGANFSGLTSSWAPFIVVAASLLKKTGRMAFVVPAEIGHAPYAKPLLSYLVANFGTIQLIALRDKLFPELSEDVWILYADGFGQQSKQILLSQQDTVRALQPLPKPSVRVDLSEWESWNFRLRPFLLPDRIRDLYQRVRNGRDSVALGHIARTGIGYVTGANEFFHLRPSEAKMLRIPDRFLVPTVRNSRWLRQKTLTSAAVESWIKRDDPILLLRLPKDESLPQAVTEYLESDSARRAKAAYKCRMRNPWYVVPDVRVPDAFLTYMSGESPQLVANAARCTCSNSVLGVSLTDGWSASALLRSWEHPITQLSCEIEGHPLGGGMLKLEPGEAARIRLPLPSLQFSSNETLLVEDGLNMMRRWRHYA